MSAEWYHSSDGRIFGPFDVPTIRSLAQRGILKPTGLHRTYISMMERGVRMPSILVAKQVAEALGTTMGTLLTKVDDEPLPTKRKKA